MSSVTAFLKANPFDSKGEPVKQLVALLAIIAGFFIMLASIGVIDVATATAIGTFLGTVTAIIKGTQTRETVYPEANLIENSPTPKSREELDEMLFLSQEPGSTYVNPNQSNDPEDA